MYDIEKLVNTLSNSKQYNLNNLTQGELKNIVGSTKEVIGVYVFYDKDRPMYVGVTEHLVQKIGKDERSKKESTIVEKVMKQLNFDSVEDSRKYVFDNYTVRFLKVENIEVAKKLGAIIFKNLRTQFNNNYI